MTASQEEKLRAAEQLGLLEVSSRRTRVMILALAVYLGIITVGYELGLMSKDIPVILHVGVGACLGYLIVAYIREVLQQRKMLAIISTKLDAQ